MNVAGAGLRRIKLGRGRLWMRSYVSTRTPRPLLLPNCPTLLPLVQSASNLLISQGPYADSNAIHRVKTRCEDEISSMEEVVTPFFVSSPSVHTRPIGFIRPKVLSALESLSRTYAESPWMFHHAPEGQAPRLWAVSFAPWVNQGGSSVRSSYMGKLVSTWRAQRLFPTILGGRTNEEYPVYHPDPQSHTSSDSTIAFAIERAALPLFGFANYGCLLTAYFHSPNTGKTMIWIPRRSHTRKNWPGRLDVTVGGGIGLGETALSTTIRESAEEASLDPDFVSQHVRSVGVISFPNRSPEGWILPGFYYLFDLPLQPDGNPAPHLNGSDGEVEAFEALSVEAVLAHLVAGSFKPSSALALVDFLIRHGHYTEASDPRYAEVCLILRRNLVLPVPWR